MSYLPHCPHASGYSIRQVVPVLASSLSFRDFFTIHLEIPLINSPHCSSVVVHLVPSSFYIYFFILENSAVAACWYMESNILRPCTSHKSSFISTFPEQFCWIWNYLWESTLPQKFEGFSLFFLSASTVAVTKSKWHSDSWFYV